MCACIYEGIDPIFRDEMDGDEDDDDDDDEEGDH